MPIFYDRPAHDTPPGGHGGAETSSAGEALRHDHPLVTIAWILAALVIAAGIGPWVSKCVGVALPAFAMVRTGGRWRTGAKPR